MTARPAGVGSGEIGYDLVDVGFPTGRLVKILEYQVVSLAVYRDGSCRHYRHKAYDWPLEAFQNDVSCELRLRKTVRLASRF